MLVEILVTDQCPACDQAVAIWRAACREAGAALEVINVNNPAGQRRLTAMRLGTVPALLIDGKLIAVGLQSEKLAHDLISAGGNH